MLVTKYSNFPSARVRGGTTNGSTDTTPRVEESLRASILTSILSIGPFLQVCVQPHQPFHRDSRKVFVHSTEGNFENSTTHNCLSSREKTRRTERAKSIGLQNKERQKNKTSNEPMVALDFHHLRNPRVIKAGVITLAAVGISVGVGVGVSNHRRGNKDVDAGTAGGDLPNEFTNEFEVLQADHLDEVEESPEYVPSAPLAPLTDEAAEKLRYYDATGGAGASGGYSDYPAYPDDDDDNGADVVDGKHSLDGKDDDGWKGGSFHDGWHGGTSHDAWDGGWNDDGNVKWEKCWYPIDGSVPQGKSGKTKGGKYQSSTYYGGKTGKTKGGYQSSTYYGGKSGKSGAGPYYGSSSGGKTNG